jgi:HAD superfamily hydrolase (TIGR01509 family)
MIDWRKFDAVLFDLDGVITPTAELHRAAWAATFAADGFTEEDYLSHIDGRPRYDGVAAFLTSRGINLPWGTESDAPGRYTICAIGNEKDQRFNRLLTRGELHPYTGSLQILDALDSMQIAYGLVTSSRNASKVLAAAELTTRFACIVDGALASREQLAGKPAPDTYLRGAALLGVHPSRAVVVEDAVSGVLAGRSGEFGYVLAIDRGGNRAALFGAGADDVVDDLADTIS